MALKNTVDGMRNMILDMSHNLEKSERGNKAAAQRVRKMSIEFAKISKVYRKESIAEAKSGTKKIIKLKPAEAKKKLKKHTPKKKKR